MPSSFNLQLDTHAPVVTWGATAGTTAGELLQVGYALDEPALVSATLRLADGRVLDLTDTGLTLEALLPPDTPNGNATVRALVRDEVLNQATRTLTIPLSGVVVAPEPAPATPGFPARAPRRRPRRPTVITSRSRVGVVATMRHRADTRRYLAIGVASFDHRMSGGPAASSSTTVARAGGHQRAELVARASSRAVSRGTVRRGDGGDLEALLALGLI